MNLDYEAAERYAMSNWHLPDFAARAIVDAAVPEPLKNVEDRLARFLADAEASNNLVLTHEVSTIGHEHRECTYLHRAWAKELIDVMEGRVL